MPNTGYAQWISELLSEVSGSAALSVKGGSANHVKLGRHINKAAATDHATLIATAPVIYVEPVPYAKSPGTMDSNRCEFAAVLHVYELYDQSASDNLLTALNFIEALTKEIMAESDGAASSWTSRGCNVRCGIDGPHDSKHNELYTRIEITANYAEAV